MESMNVNIKLLNEKAVVPAKANNDDGNACYDVVATSVKINHGDNFIEYGLGFATEFSSDWECQIRPRSSLSKYDLILANTPGTIDSNYRGEWKIRFKVVDSRQYFNNEVCDRIYKAGDKIAQISFHKVTKTLFNKVDELDASLRGDGGFGSTDANA